MNLFGLHKVRMLVAVCMMTALAIPASGAGQDSSGEWPSYGNDPGGQRYSPLDQINRDNVAKLKVAWTYHTGDVSNGSKTKRKSSFENTPIVVDGTMYLSTPFNRVIALDPATGHEKWTFDPKIDLQASYSEGLINRGVSSWVDPSRAPGQPCARRIFIATIDARLIALDAATGIECNDFGVNGQVNLKTAGITVQTVYNGEYEETSPPAIIDDLVVVGSAIGDNTRVNEPPGMVRAFDTRTGALRWSFNPIPKTADDPGWKEWKPEQAQTTGAANVWSIISVDPQNDLVFLPGASASPDYYGGDRLGSNLYADALVALHAKTGKIAWAFQTTHHNLWDYDLPSMPLLCTIHHGGADIPAVVQGTKRGSLFNRVTGEPIFPITEKPVPKSDVPGEEAAPTQPFPELPPPIVPQTVSADDAFGVTFFDRRQCRTRMEALRSEGIFTPPSIKGSLLVPGNAGGMNWSSAAFDPKRQLFVTNTNNLVAEVHLIPRDQFTERATSLTRGFGVEYTEQNGTPYGMSRVIMLSSLGFPCNPPPWGSLTAVDLSSGQIKWTVPLGNILATSKIGSMLPDPGWGTPNFGGAIVTAGGLVFIGASMDPTFRAFDVESGKLLWKTELPAGGQATPMTYKVGDKQYIVIAAGGHGKLGSKLGDSVVAFALGDAAAGGSNGN
jgi:quinoprotein glucose dehydrogenase